MSKQYETKISRIHDAQANTHTSFTDQSKVILIFVAFEGKTQIMKNVS